MKIAHVTSGLCRKSAGLGTAVASVSAMTASAETRVFGLTSSDWVTEDCFTWTGAPAVTFPVARWSGPLRYAPAMLPALFEFDPDIVHLHGIWTYPSIAVYRWHRQTRRPYLLSAHGMLMPVSLQYKRARKKAAQYLFQNKVLFAASVLHATSKDEEAAYRSFGLRNHTELIPLGIDLVDAPAVRRTSSRRRVAFLGRLHHQKGVDLLIDAWSRVEVEFPDWDLGVVGPVDPAYRHDFQRLRQLASGHRVRFEGPLYGREKISYLAHSDLFVLPSRSENFGLTAAESLALGVPVIATQATPWSGLISADAGWWVKTNSSALEASLREAMRMDRQALHAKGENGRRWIGSDYSSKAVGIKWQLAYERVANVSNETSLP